MDLYERRLIARSSGRAPQGGGAAAPVVDEQASQVARSVDDFMKTVGPIVGRAYAASETTRVDAQLLKARARMDEWQRQYMTSGQPGKVEDYVAKWGEISRETMEGFGGNGNEVFRELLSQRLTETGMRYASDGFAYEHKTQAEALANQERAQVDEYLRNAGARPDDVDGMIAERENLKASMSLKHPGQDLSAEFNSLDEKGLEAMAEGMLARNDPEGVRKLLEHPAFRQGGTRQLGEVVKQFESGNQGLQAIAWDRNGGTSYGTYQLSSKQGSFEEWLTVLERAGEDGKYAARQLQFTGSWPGSSPSSLPAPRNNILLRGISSPC